MLDLLTRSANNTIRQTTGQWCTVRMCLDLAADEWLNVGILFVGSAGEKCYKLIENFTGFGCIYDEDATSAARFLVDQAEFALETGAPIPKGWNIDLGTMRFARGSAPQAIVDDLFNRLVPLAKHQQDNANRVDREDHQHATKNVRAKVRGLINKHLNLAKSATPEFWRKAPIPAQRDGSDIQIDIQLTRAVNGQSVYGAIASAWYKTHYHRSASLSQSSNALATACKAFPQSKNILYLLVPPANSPGLSPEDHLAIEKDIGTNKWSLEQEGAIVKIARAETTMAEAILGDLGLLHSVG